MQTFTARYVLVDGEFRENCSVTVGADGRIAAVGKATVGPALQSLGEVALVPGLVNAHSHAFQRAIRGRTEWIDPSRPDDDFWTWREQMYAAATTFSPEQVFAVSRWAFLEMLLSGITTVGEFHYLHHQPDGAPYADPNELAHQVIAAAKEVGIRIALLRVAYRRGGHDREVTSEQLRFLDGDDEALVSRVEALRRSYSGDSLVSIGLAPHSIRAVPGETLAMLGELAESWDAPLHIHACEQRREIDESVAEYGKPPLEVFEQFGILNERLTLVHATHLSEQELALAGQHKPTVCACPTTERNLGDGFLPAAELMRREVPISLGSDSHTNIDLWEEARCVEYHERLRHERRNVLPAAAGRRTTAEVLWPMLTQHGARSLRLPIGSLEAGKHADFVAIDLEHPTLVGTSAQSLLTDLCLSVTPGAVRDVWVGGKQVVAGGRHSRTLAARHAFERLVG